ncbi:hypothetical protein [Microcoleus sp. FACHB-672]|uniref:hypothetical protein n=1 Tax=Microcoleus sp. FACHB-672 TaxID=2692825 RepID=UPI001685C2D0|nr:hypothetical protein [Microcoleus sp. FACHB-672]MBD2041327.1 hypothetical protein [Microcoleus sp. FACHB-672]
MPRLKDVSHFCNEMNSLAQDFRPQIKGNFAKALGKLHGSSSIEPAQLEKPSDSFPLSVTPSSGNLT